MATRARYDQASFVFRQGFVVFVDGFGGGFGFHLQSVEFDREFREQVLVGIAFSLHAAHFLANPVHSARPFFDLFDKPLDSFKSRRRFRCHISITLSLTDGYMSRYVAVGESRRPRIISQLFGVSPLHGQTPTSSLSSPINRADTLSLDKRKEIG